MKLMDCVDWERAAVTAMKRYDEARRAVELMKGELKALSSAAGAGGRMSCATPQRGGGSAPEARMAARVDGAEALRRNARECREFMRGFDAAWGALEERERRVLQLRYRSALSYTRAMDALADELCCDRARVGKLSDEALSKLTLLLFGA